MLLEFGELSKGIEKIIKEKRKFQLFEWKLVLSSLSSGQSQWGMLNIGTIKQSVNFS